MTCSQMPVVLKLYCETRKRERERERESTVSSSSITHQGIQPIQLVGYLQHTPVPTPPHHRHRQFPRRVHRDADLMLVVVRERHLPDVDGRIQDGECRQREARGFDEEGLYVNFLPG